MSELEVKVDVPLRSVVEELFPSGYKLLPGVNQIYELELALAEYRSLAKEDLIRRSAYFHKVEGIETFHHKLCTGAPLKIDKSTSVRLRTFFQAYQFKTGYSTHGLFPYRGKFHPQLIKAIMNIIGVRAGDMVLDSMTGSGTTNVEASILGIDSIGIEASPFCCLMAKAKADALKFNPKRLRELAQEPNEIFEHYHRENRVNLSEYIDRGEGYAFAKDPPFDNFFKLCYLDAMGYARRRKTGSIEELFPIVLDKYVSAVLNFILIRNQFGLKLGNVAIGEGDTRDLQKIYSGDIDEIKDESIDGIVTSPPYSFAIDYLEGDRLQLEYMGYDIEKLRAKMIGLRGRAMMEKVRNYLTDMNEAIGEMSRVLRTGKYCVIVIGSNVIQLQRTLEGETNTQNFDLEGFDMNMRLEDALAKIGEKHDLELVKRLSRPIEGVQNIMRTEEVLFLRKK